MAHPHPQPRLTVVFIHGFLSSPQAWAGFTTLLGSDPDLAGVQPCPFGYASPPVSLRPDRQIPRFDDVADNLWTFLTHDLADRSRLVLVTHSQGGLIVQRMLARTLADGRGGELSRIGRIVMFACPNSGAEIVLLLRRWLSRNPQERELRPLHDAVIETQRRVLNQVVYATGTGPDRCPIRIAAYAGDRDAVVKPTVAKGVFPETGVLPGDHSSIIRPDTHHHRSYTALKHHLAGELAGELAGGTPVPQPAPAPRREAGSAAAAEVIVDRLLAVPGMATPAFRERVYALLPDDVRHALPRDGVVRVELAGVVDTLDRYRHLAAWNGLLSALSALVPRHPTIEELRLALADRGVTGAGEV